MQQTVTPIPGIVCDKNVAANANIKRLIHETKCQDLRSFHRWSVEHYADFWALMCKELNIIFKKPPINVCDLSFGGASTPRWFPGATMNIIDSCFNADEKAVAIIYQDNNQQLHHITYSELSKLVNRIANSLVHAGFRMGDAIGIAMPMDYRAIAIYLAIIKMGGVVVSIADSFSAPEMTTRLRIANAQAVFTQDIIQRGDRSLPLYEKVTQTSVAQIIVLPYADLTISPRPSDTIWQDFLVNDDIFTSVACDPMAACNILFSSGTTGEPKAIPWNHTTPIKAASDAYLHQNIKPGDVLAWPTNLGWMMGPWLVFAALINRASIAVYTNLPKDRAFGEFVAQSKVTMLGVVPTLVATWRQSRCMEDLNWSAIKVFSSTGECSNPEDMSYLMALAGGKPVIEYCGGTEVGGAYISSTVIENNYPSICTTATMGSDFVILDEAGKLANCGEVALIPPAIGLSTTLLNNDHQKIYFAGMPTIQEGITLRRHGDQIKRLDNGYYMIQGRVDDTMNLGGIKISSAEIERSFAGLPNITESAAIAIMPSSGGPSLLVIYVVSAKQLDKQGTLKLLQQRITQQINPLFKIHDIVFVPELPKTASNKIMRRLLRDDYQLSN